MKLMDLVLYLSFGIALLVFAGMTFALAPRPELGWLLLLPGSILTSLGTISLGVLWGMQAFNNEREDAGV